MASLPTLCTKSITASYYPLLICLTISRPYAYVIVYFIDCNKPKLIKTSVRFEDELCNTYIIFIGTAPIIRISHSRPRIIILKLLFGHPFSFRTIQHIDLVIFTFIIIAFNYQLSYICNICRTKETACWYFHIHNGISLCISTQS